MKVEIKKKKRLTVDVCALIRNDIPLRGKIAEAFDIEKKSVYELAVKNSPRLALPFIAEIIVKHTGLKESEIFEKESNNQN